MYVVKCHVEASFLFSLKEAELQGAAPWSLRCVWLPSLLKSILPQSWVLHHTGERVFPLPGTEFMVEKNSITSQWGKASSSFPFYWTERRGSSETNAEQKSKSRALNWSLEMVLLTPNASWGDLPGKLDATRVVRIHSISVHCNHAQGKYLFYDFLKTFITSSSYLCTWNWEFQSVIW